MNDKTIFGVMVLICAEWILPRPDMTQDKVLNDGYGKK